MVNIVALARGSKTFLFPLARVLSFMVTVTVLAMLC